MLACAAAALAARDIQEQLQGDEVRWGHVDYYGTRLIVAVTKFQIKMAPPMGEFLGMLDHANLLAASHQHQQLLLQRQQQLQRHQMAMAGGEQQQGCSWIAQVPPACQERPLQLQP